MATLAQVILFALLGGVVSLIGGFILLSNKKAAKSLEAYGMPFAAGALLAAVFLDLLTGCIEDAPASNVLTATMIGIGD